MRDGATRSVARRWPFWIALTAYLLATGAFIALSVRQNAGFFVYPLDDTYIHLAMAKNAALHHVWGVTRHAFTSSSSSPLWTALLAAVCWIAGVRDVLPLALNVLFGGLLIAVCYRVLQEYVASPPTVAGILLAIVFATPLPTLTMIGMEHVLHTLLSVCFVHLSVRALVEPVATSRRLLPAVAVVAALTASARYEGLFLVTVVAAVFAHRRRYLEPLAVGAAAILPLAAYGGWSISHGWWLVPNSILLKGQAPAPTVWGVIDWLALALKKMAMGQLVPGFVAAIAALALLRRRDGSSFAAARLMNGMLAAAIALHTLFSSTGAFFRYEAYLIALALLIAGVSGTLIIRSRPLAAAGPAVAVARAVSAIAAILLLISSGQRGANALRTTVTATTNIYQQQYQMGLFVRQFYQGHTIAANDIGAVSYLADIRLLDLWGLGSMEPARRKRAGTYSTAAILQLSREAGATAAVLYDGWFRRFGGLPEQWIAAGRWTIPNNVVCGGDTVTFYAVDPSAAPELRANLSRFAAALPPPVLQQGAYLSADAR